MYFTYHASSSGGRKKKKNAYRTNKKKWRACNLCVNICAR